MKILQILPRVPPAVCGIGDYAWLLARELREKHGIHSSFLTAGIGRNMPCEQTEFTVFRLLELESQTLVDFITSKAGEFDAVVLHVSAYGYQKRALPFWLARAWQQVSRLKSKPRMVSMFHELFASGSMRSSAFWLQPLQKLILRTIARASDRLRTNRQAYGEWLKRVSGVEADAVTVMPVFSNFGEPEIFPVWSAREPAMAVFTWGIHSGESLDAVVHKAAAHARQFALSKVHLIGGGKLVLSESLGVEIVRHGFMEATGMSSLLGSCQMAYTAYNPQFLGKSTLMAAFAVHGLAVITQGTTAILPDGLQHGVNVINQSLCSTAEPSGGITAETVGRALRDWYDGHSRSANAASYAKSVGHPVAHDLGPKLI